jgi:succinoglycan biosynthesis protein ExoM
VQLATLPVAVGQGLRQVVDIRPRETILTATKGVTVCVATYRRPEGLRRLLLGLNQQRFVKCSEPYVEIVVVDNDPAGSAHKPCEDLRKELRWPLRYCLERQPGISYARNSALACVDDSMDFAVFIDDDEVPGLLWLDELLYVQQAYAADVVAGPQISCFDKRPPRWVEQGKFFEHPRHPTGQPLKMAHAANVLMNSDVFKEMKKPFDERFALIGGEDTHFFMRVHQDGRKMVWADEALVYEFVPESRIKVRWILRRSYRHGNTLSLCDRDLAASTAVHLKRLLKGSARVVQGILFLPASFLVGTHAFVQALTYLCHGAGTLAGMTGKVYEEYQRAPRSG